MREVLRYMRTAWRYRRLLRQIHVLESIAGIDIAPEQIEVFGDRLIVKPDAAILEQLAQRLGVRASEPWRWVLMPFPIIASGESDPVAVPTKINYSENVGDIDPEETMRSIIDYPGFQSLSFRRNEDQEVICDARIMPDEISVVYSRTAQSVIEAAWRTFDAIQAMPPDGPLSDDDAERLSVNP